MISMHFLEIAIIVHYIIQQKIQSKDDSYNFNFIACPSFEESLDKREIKIKNILEIFFKANFRSGWLS